MLQRYADPAEMNMPFEGAKIALLLGDRMIVILRDDRGDIPWPDHWDLPGGGREGAETPVECALRETREELGLGVPPGAILWARRFRTRERDNWFFVARLPETVTEDIIFGDEGQRWMLMKVATFLQHPKAVPQFRGRLRMFLKQGSDTKNPPLL